MRSREKHENWMKIGNLRSQKMGEQKGLEERERGYALFAEMRKKLLCPEM